ncbi:amino acid adenylation domain-containing protein [Streptomyces europaeiscabiei]|uniref:amino acid adenylation domain-containing protein n=1 Tax=Streptomyces europaeiscabiei TaxID=146819 RepID=UPI0029B122CD|nr:amino acid adenylation domain-containing protein [Streptomyces europaeiscabiei]MDX3697438.1 amino acid adenylation domain-containing protein [Streptomyces europaeiscabiei]
MMTHPVLIHEAVSQQATAKPGATAVISDAERLSYAELDAAAGKVAHALRERGVTRGSVVPVILPRSAQLITVLLGVLKCGAAYAAMDPNWPDQRVHALLQTLHPPVLIATAPSPAHTAVPVWSPPATWPASASGAAPLSGISDAEPATVFFTSGTSGSSKAVLSPHRATTRLFREHTDWWPGGSVVAQVAPASWDAFSLEVWGALLTGGTCVVHPSGHLLPGGLRTLVGAARVDTVFLTTSLFNFLVEEDVDCFRGLRRVLVGGERLSAHHVRTCLERHTLLRVSNCYGPVENCVFASVHAIGRQDCDLADGIPLGSAVPGTGIHVLRNGRPAGPGVTGEICLSGDGLALGYLTDPQLTAEKFPTVPIDGGARRVYRTGDLGWLDQDGLLHFRGRGDRQIKVAGHRVEPAEIEAAGRAVPGVRECAVLPISENGGNVIRLAMFYVPTPPTAPGEQGAASPAAVRKALSARLPRYLVPHLLRPCASFPLTTRGKVDPAALLASLPSAPRPRTGP